MICSQTDGRTHADKHTDTVIIILRPTATGVGVISKAPTDPAAADVESVRCAYYIDQRYTISFANRTLYCTSKDSPSPRRFPEPLQRLMPQLLYIPQPQFIVQPPIEEQRFVINIYIYGSVGLCVSVWLFASISPKPHA